MHPILRLTFTEFSHDKPDALYQCCSTMYLLANDSQILLCILWTFPLAKTSACYKNNIYDGSLSQCKDKAQSTSNCSSNEAKAEIKWPMESPRFVEKSIYFTGFTTSFMPAKTLNIGYPIAHRDRHTISDRKKKK